MRAKYCTSIDTNRIEKTWLLPKIPGYSLNSCPACEHVGLRYIQGEGEAAPTGASSLYATLFCDSCGLYWYAAEYDD